MVTIEYVVLFLHHDSIFSWFSFSSRHQASWLDHHHTFHLPSLCWTLANHGGKHSQCTESHEMPSHPCLQLSPPHYFGLYVKTYSGTTSTSMRYHLGSIGPINGAYWKDPDANKENPQGPSCQDLRHALCIRLEVSLVFILLFSILFSFSTTLNRDSVTVESPYIQTISESQNPAQVAFGSSFPLYPITCLFFLPTSYAIAQKCP